MSGYRGNSPQMVEGDHEVDPSLTRRLAHLSTFFVGFVVVAVLAWSFLGRFDPTASAYLSNHPGGLWALSLLLFAGLGAYLAGQEYGRREEAVRTSARRTARASRASRPSRSAPAAAPADCRQCAELRAENAALAAELEALRPTVVELAVAEDVAPEPSAADSENEPAEVLETVEVVEVLELPAEPELRETT